LIDKKFLALLSKAYCHDKTLSGDPEAKKAAAFYRDGLSCFNSCIFKKA